MGLFAADDHWRLTDELWKRIEPLLPAPPSPADHPLGCHRRRGPNRRFMEGILFVLRTGCQWNALNGTGICNSSTAHRRFQEWCNAGVFLEFWKAGLLEYDFLKGIDWGWLSMDGAMTKAPLGGKRYRPQPHGPGQTRHQAQCSH